MAEYIKRKSGEEMFSYRAVFPISIWRMLREVCMAEDRTVIMQLVMWVREGYDRWKEQQDTGSAGGRPDSVFRSTRK